MVIKIAAMTSEKIYADVIEWIFIRLFNRV